MRKILSTLGLSVCATLAFCQQDTLLKKFKYRIDHYRSIGFNLGGGSNFARLEPAAGTIKNTTASGSFGGSYFTTKSTDRILLTTASGLSSFFNIDKSDNQNSIDKNRNFNLTPYGNILNKWFSKNKFTELGAAVSGNFSTNKNTMANEPVAAKSRLTQYSIAVNTGIGKGRLENITDMQNALWLNNALTEAKRLSRQLTPEELNGLGRSITKANNTRILDSRKRTQFILATVDDYLQQNGLISKTDISYFSNLNDILFFAFNNPRISGTEKFIRFTPAVYKEGNNQDYNNGVDKFRHRFNNQSLTLSSGFSKNTPVSLTRQNNYGATAKLFYMHSDFSDRYFTSNVLSDEVKRKTETKQAGLNLFYQYAFYPNTRTTISFNANSEAGYQDVGSIKNFYADIDLYGTLYYFIGYRTRLTGSAGAGYQKNGYSFYQYIELVPDAIRLYANAGIEINL